MSVFLAAEAVSLETRAQLSVSCYSIAAVADPGVMPRVLELFAKRGLVPLAWHGRRVGPGQEELAIDIQMPGLSRPEAQHIAACLRQIPFVSSVLTHERDAAVLDG